MTKILCWCSSDEADAGMERKLKVNQWKHWRPLQPITVADRLGCEQPLFCSGREEVRWTTSTSGRPDPRHNCWWWPSAEESGRGSLLNRLSCSPDDQVDQGAEPKWILCHLVRKSRQLRDLYCLHFFELVTALLRRRQKTDEKKNRNWKKQKNKQTKNWWPTNEDWKVETEA